MISVKKRRYAGKLQVCNLAGINSFINSFIPPLLEAMLRNNLRQVVYTYVPLSQAV